MCRGSTLINLVKIKFHEIRWKFPVRHISASQVQSSRKRKVYAELLLVSFIRRFQRILFCKWKRIRESIYFLLQVKTKKYKLKLKNTHLAWFEPLTRPILFKLSRLKYCGLLLLIFSRPQMFNFK